MPRVQTRVKSTRGKPYVCSTCNEAIKPGEAFYYWTFRYGGTRRRHTHHGYPRQSMLTQSRMGDVYAAVENVEDIIGGEGWSLEDARGAVEELQGVVDEVVEAYREAAEHFGGAGENAERADELESYSSDLYQLDLSEWEESESAEESGGSVSDEDWRENAKAHVEEVIGGAP